jgi:glycosyltransferase 2 family protein
MKLRVATPAILGALLALFLVTQVGWRAVFSAALTVGWGGFAVLCLYVVVPFVVLGAAWDMLLPGWSVTRTWLFVRARMLRDAVAEILPFTQLGGMALGVRAAILLGVASPLASASMIVDVTTEMLAQIAYLALGVAILTARLPRTSLVVSLTTAALVGLALAAVAAGLFLALQRRSRRIAARLSASGVTGQISGAVCEALEAIHRSPARVALSAALHFAAWMLNAVGTWLCFRLLGRPLDLAAVIAIESLVYAVRSAAVLIPNALGVQEAAYALLGPLFGVGAPVALAVSLLKRARDITVGVPVLLIWQAAEGRRALAAGAPGRGSPGPDASGSFRAPAWMQGAVFALDRWLCRWQTVYEFTDDPRCLFRIQCVRLDAAVELADGTCAHAGSRILALHLWNEHVPLMGRGGPTLAWACRADRAVRSSLRELAGYLAAQPALGDIAAIRADMRVSGPSQAVQFARLLARYGFEALPGQADRRGVLHRIGDAILILMLVSVTNPLALRTAALRLVGVRLWLSRAVLERRYPAAAVSVTGGKHSAPLLSPERRAC